MKRLLLALAAIAIAVFAQSRLDWLLPVYSRPFEAAALYLLAVVIFVVLFRKHDEAFVVGEARPTERRGFFLAGAMLALVAVALAALSAPRFLSETPAPGGWTLHLLSAGAILLAAVCLHLAQRPLDAPRVAFRVRWQAWRDVWGVPAVALLALVAAAAVMRLHNLELLPEGIWFDEAVNALIARRILTTPDYTPFYLAETYHTAHHDYLVAFSFWLFGESIASARLVSAVMGIAMVPAGWLLGYEFFQTRPARGRTRALTPLTLAFVMAALLAFVPWSLNLSRIAVNYIATPLFVVLSTGLLLRGLRTQRLLAYAGAGLALALGLVGYTSFRLFAPVLPLFVLAVLASRREAWRNSWRGLVTLTVVAVVISTPLITFAVANHEEFMQRASDVSLFKDQPAEARGALLIDNLRAHLLMFNVEGDANGRHNLPARPMLDPWLGPLFVLGSALALWRWRNPRFFLLLLWFGFTLLGGVLSLGFEAPQSLRANGVLPVALLLALVPIGEILRLWEHSDGGVYYPRFLPAVAVTALMPLLLWNWNAFFRVQTQDFAVWNSFSTGETLIARQLAELSPETSDVWLMSYFQVRGDVHPVQEFLAPQWKGLTKRLHTWDSMPLVWTPEKDAWLFFDFDTLLPFQTLQSFYPDGDYRELKPDFSPSVAGRLAHLTTDVLATAQGMDLTWLDADDAPLAVVRMPQIALDLPEAAPTDSVSGEFTGILRILEYGDYRLALAAPTAAELWIDETSILTGTGEMATTLPLATGNHTVRLRFTVPASQDDAGSLALAWARPATDDEPVPAAVLFSAPVTANGLLGVYRSGGESAPDEETQAPLLAAIDQQIHTIFHTTPVNRPFHAEWTGKLAIPADGTYRFSANGINTVTVEIDGELVVTGGDAGVRTEVSLPLGAGLHDLRVTLQAVDSFTRVLVEWAPPGLDFGPIPFSALFPPRGSYAGVAMPLLALPEDAVSQPNGATTDALEAVQPDLGPLLDTPVTIIATNLLHPVGIAVGNGWVYVAESQAAQVRRYAVEGGSAELLAVGDDSLVEPFDLALASDGTLVVSDAGAPALYRFSADGAFDERIAVDAPLIDRARGMDVAADGSILVAQTPGQRIVHLESDGSERFSFPVMPTVDAQPVDVAAWQDGYYAALLGVNLLVYYNASGSAEIAFPIATANSQDAPHLALGPAGDLFITQPEEGRILWYTADHRIAGHWDLRSAYPDIKPAGIALEERNGITRVWFTDANGGRVGWVSAPALEDGQ